MFFLQNITDLFVLVPNSIDPLGTISLTPWELMGFFTGKHQPVGMEIPGPKAESIPWEIDDLFVVDELTASSMPPQNSTRSISSVASGDLGADDDAVVGIRWDIFWGSYLTPMRQQKMGWDFRDEIFGMGISRDKGTKTLPPNGRRKWDVSFED